MAYALKDRPGLLGQLANNIAGSGGGGGGGAGGGGSGTTPDYPPMPTTSSGAGWSLQASTNFDYAANEGSFLATPAYGGSAAANDIGKMKFAEYVYGTDKDTRVKRTTEDHAGHTVTSCVITAGSQTVTAPAGSFSSAWWVIGPRVVVAQGYIPDSITCDFVSPTQITLSSAATNGGTVSIRIAADFGYYDQNYTSVTADGILRHRIFRDLTSGQIHVSGIRPKLGGSNTLPFGVLGGRFTVCHKFDVMPGIKCAWLLFRDSDPGNGVNGEIDWFEQPELTHAQTASGFMHWQGGGGNQSTYTSTIDATDGSWHVSCIEWRPDQATPANSSLVLKSEVVNSSGLWIPGTTNKTWTGANVPNQKMHWVLQTETKITGYTTALPTVIDGYVSIAWVTFEVMV